MKYALSALMTSLVLSTPVWAQQKADEHAGHHAASSPTATADEMTDAEVRKVDLDAAKITLKHGDIKSLEMPAMTMVFNVRDKAMLGQVKAGDKVKFKAVNEAGKFTVTDLKVVR
ncbi:MAG: copper-binding protein [Aquincola sp.]|uniref:Copper-binding protein n=1 Tax=Aquincola tertiaricarbonis TaxID=391953 RepID=A0ABY4S5R2_AQUTE|nr:copper-binding protein [Aquincola tertiaricarbonis]MBQ1763627.1 copper-binding protein [Aquincola sp.]URI07779.1 copper-binding protein [Aquincola tertiaricarbonis]|tara:strand:- start:3149 stop:3493 length:345 start_codon:yes stop_codon:yes gene_type:complete